MHQRHLRECLRDTDIACAIRPLVNRKGLSYDDVLAALDTLNLPRAPHIATLVTHRPSIQP